MTQQTVLPPTPLTQPAALPPTQLIQPTALPPTLLTKSALKPIFGVCDSAIQQYSSTFSSTSLASNAAQQQPTKTLPANNLNKFQQTTHNVMYSPHSILNNTMQNSLTHDFKHISGEARTEPVNYSLMTHFNTNNNSSFYPNFQPNNRNY